MKKPTVSILIPSYNQGRFIGRAIDSILSEDCGCQIIVMDAASSDETRTVVESYGARVLFVSEKDRGQSHALNKALALATGDWIGWQNSDDYYEPGGIINFINAVERDNRADSSCDIYFGHATISDEFSVTRFIKYYTPFVIDDLLINGFNITNQSAFFRTELVRSIGGWDESLHHCMDLDFFIRLHDAGGKFCLINKILGSFRVHSLAKSSNLHQRRIDEWALIIPKHRKGDTIQDILCRRKRERVYWLFRRIWHLLILGRLPSYTKYRLEAYMRRDPVGHPAENYR